ncbi:MAG: MFS transporter [Oceanospirillaceae bacterium]|nr:MFS transporter [Oceanospirillaceae bacterium]
MITRDDLPALLTGVSTTLAGIGVARFAYTPLLPELIQAGWFSDSKAVYLGAANLMGYLIGALSAHRLSEHIPLRVLLCLCFSAIALSFLLCAQPASFGWFFSWRFIAGICGAILMVVGPATALTRTPPVRRTGVGALVFTGIGLGAILSASVVPLLIQVSLSVTWLTLAALTLLIGWICDHNLVRLAKTAPQGESGLKPSSAPGSGIGLVLLLVLLAYALDAIGFVPHTVFWVDYLAREQRLGTESASLQWAVFGVGAVCGPLTAAWIVQRLGWSKSLTLAFIIKTLAVGLPLLSITLVSRTLSSFIVGALVPAVVALTSGRIAELVGPIEHKRYWGYATAIFAIAQAIAGYVMSAFYETAGSYHLLFYVGSAALAVGAVLIVFSHHLGKTDPIPSKAKEQS